MDNILNDEILKEILEYCEEHKSYFFKEDVINDLREYIEYCMEFENNYLICNCHSYDEKTGAPDYKNILLANSPFINKDINNNDYLCINLLCSQCGAMQLLDVKILICNVVDFFTEDNNGSEVFTEERVFHVNCSPEILKKNMEKFNDIAGGSFEKFQELLLEFIKENQVLAEVKQIPSNPNPPVKQDKPAPVIPIKRK